MAKHRLRPCSVTVPLKTFHISPECSAPGCEGKKKMHCQTFWMVSPGFLQWTTRQAVHCRFGLFSGWILPVEKVGVSGGLDSKIDWTLNQMRGCRRDGVAACCVALRQVQTAVFHIITWTWGQAWPLSTGCTFISNHRGVKKERVQAAKPQTTTESGTEVTAILEKKLRGCSTCRC